MNGFFVVKKGMMRRIQTNGMGAQKICAKLDFLKNEKKADFAIEVAATTGEAEKLFICYSPLSLAPQGSSQHFAHSLKRDLEAQKIATQLAVQNIAVLMLSNVPSVRICGTVQNAQSFEAMLAASVASATSVGDGLFVLNRA